MMNKGVEILLERIKTNPDEFEAYGRDSKWENLVYKYAECLEEEDKEAFKKALKHMRQERFTQEVMKQLLTPDEEQLDLDFEPFGKATVKGGTITYKTKGRILTP
jgi:formate dehydrogenase maturation protein FdhE